MTKLFIREEGQERIYHIEDDVISMGRVQGNHIVIKDPRSSRKHCKIVRTPKGFKIFDLKSRNGIFVNGKPTKEKMLQKGDKIEIGDTVIYFEGTAPENTASENMASQNQQSSWCIEITSGSQKGSSFALGEDPLLLGRHKAADILLEDPSIAPHHAHILPSDQGYFLADLNSQEGTFVNGKKIKKILLKPEMVIILGKTHFRFCRAEQTSSSSLDDVEEIILDDFEETAFDDDFNGDASGAKKDSKEESNDSPKVSPPKKRSVKKSSRRVKKKPSSEEWGGERGFPSQADFEALDLDQIQEGSPTATIAMSFGIPILLVILFVVGVKFMLGLFSIEVLDPSKEGNKLKNWSFEKMENNQPLHWKLTKGASLDRETSLGGKFSLKLEGGTGPIPQVTSDKILISSKKIYFLRAYQKTAGTGPWAIKALWTNEDTGFSRLTYPTVIGKGGDWKEKTALLQPPRLANTLQIGFACLGRGMIWIDRVFLEERDPDKVEYVEEPYGVEMGKDFVFQINSRGIFSIQRGSPPRLYISGGHLELFSVQPDNSSSQILAIIPKRVQWKKTSLELEGKIYHRKTNKWYGFREKITRGQNKDHRKDQLTLSFDLQGDGPLPILGLRMFRNSSLPVRVAESRKTTSDLGENFEVSEVGEISLGKTGSQVVFAFSEKARVKGWREKRKNYLTLDWQNKGKIVLVISKTSKTEREEEARRIGLALGLEAEGKLEEAGKAWKELARIFSYKKELVQRAKKKSNLFRDRRQTRRRELEKISRDMANLPSPFLVESSKKKCQAIAKAYPSLADQAKKILDQLDSLEKELAKKANLRAGRELLDKANTILGQGLATQNWPTLALAGGYYREIVLRYPQDPAVLQEAQNKLKLIYRRIEHQFAKLLKR